MKEKKLYRSRNEKMLAGVCGGVAEYFGVDATVVRLIWAAVTFFAGVGILIYIAAAIIMPYPPENAEEEVKDAEYTVVDDPVTEEGEEKADDVDGVDREDGAEE